ncbi:MULTISPECIES: hypothetical protein [Bacillaceae]|uniref:Uncharacterized protein n=1 Tax=Evansella alkalicola TaxID=745819 RepID=A0ABS6JN96_9BACI|nr:MULTISPECIES: hypothetical protein [Bacillaceae]MBU9720026.1 hypothetical protein [Bacillus alkalicola]
MGSGCGSMRSGQEVVDHVKSKGKENFPPRVAHVIECECGHSFTMETVIMNCPSCEMTFAVTPCSSGDINNIKVAGIKYA